MDLKDTWTGTAPDELEDWLIEAGIDTRMYGTGQAKSVTHLCEEVRGNAAFYFGFADEDLWSSILLSFIWSSIVR
jgi:hypothetical protein